MESWYRWRQSGRKKVLGIDITAAAVNIVEIIYTDNSTKSNIYVHSYTNAPLPDNALTGHVITDVKVVADCINHALDAASIHTKNAVLALHDTAIITKIIQIANNFALSKSIPHAIDEQILLQAYLVIPFSTHEINIDFGILGLSHASNTQLDVLVVASKTEHINRCTALAKYTGLNVKIIDVVSHAAARTINHLTKIRYCYTNNDLIFLIHF